MAAKDKSAAKKAPAKKAAAKKTAVKKTAAKKTAAKKAPAKKAVAKKAVTKPTPAKKAPVKKAPAKKAGSAAKGSADSGQNAPPAPRGVTKDGIAYTKDFDAKFLKAQRDALLAERGRLLGQAEQLTAEANQLIEEAEMGDVQFDDEGGEGDTMAVERERDLALSAQAREAVAAIDDALARLEVGTYGYSVVSGRPIPRERLEAIPWSTELVEEKVGGIGRR